MRTSLRLITSVVASLAIIGSNPSLTAAEPANSKASLGMGLTGIADWSTEQPFIDLMKSARSWVTKCPEGQDCPFDTQEAALLDLDENGWVKSLPAPDDPKVRYRAVETFVIAEGEASRVGRYIILYDGEGALNYQGVRYEGAMSRPGRHVVVLPKNADTFSFSIRQTNPQNYVRNIRIVREQDEKSFAAGEVFNPEFLQKIAPFGTLRFMDWMATNQSKQSEWSGRPKVSDATWSAKGVPLEIMIQLANKLSADPWFNMPHLATTEYVAKFAEVVKTSLDPKLRPYVEYSNETWNWMFQQTHDNRDAAKERWGDSPEGFMQWHGMKSAEQCKSWKAVFGNDSGRVRCVISSQSSWHGLEQAALDCPLYVAEGHEPCSKAVDVYAIAGYVSGALGDPANTKLVTDWMAEPDGGIASAFAELRSGSIIGGQSGSLADVADDFRYHRAVAEKHGLQLTVYEGGQHIVGTAEAIQNDKLTEFFITLNRRPEMGALYKDLLTTWKDNGGGLFVHFVAIGGASRWGSWGSLESVTQSGSPKYDALVRYSSENPCWWKDCAR